MGHIGFAEALKRALEGVPAPRTTRWVSLERALGQICAGAVTARRALPPFDNAAMDGYALRHEEGGKELKVASTILAGAPLPEGPLKAGNCYRIMTGARVPEDVDAVVPLERCEAEGDRVRIPGGIRPESNLRRRGEEVAPGSVLIPEGTMLEASHIALLSAQGITEIEVYVPLRIALFSTGDEVKEPWEEAPEHAVYNANAFGLSALLEQYGFLAHYVGRLPDDPERIRARLEGVEGYDLIITSGGISGGDADYLYEIFLERGLEPLFHGVNLKPGRPTMMGRMGRSFVMALPGNPLAALLNLWALGLPVLYRMQGARRVHHRRMLLPLGEELRLRGGRTELVLGELRAGRFYPTMGHRYGSGMLTPLAASDALVVVGESVEHLPVGSLVEAVLFGDRGRDRDPEVVQ